MRIASLSAAFFAAAAIVTVVAMPASAQMTVTADKDPAKVEAGTYAIEPYHTRVMFSVLHMGFSNYYGQFTGASGTLTIDPKKVAAASFDITVPTASVSTTNDKLDGELKSTDWLDATKYPTIEFKSASVKRAGSNEAEVTGDLTLHGVTKPVTLKVKFIGAGPNPMSKKVTAGFQLSGKIKRSDFGVTKYVPLIGDDVDLIIAAAFEKQG